MHNSVNKNKTITKTLKPLYIVKLGPRKKIFPLDSSKKWHHILTHLLHDICSLFRAEGIFLPHYTASQSRKDNLHNHWCVDITYLLLR